MASAYSVFSLAIRVKLLISGLLFIFKSCKASRKSAATSAAGRDMMGKYMREWAEGIMCCVRGDMTVVRKGQGKRVVLRSEKSQSRQCRMPGEQDRSASSLSNTRNDSVCVGTSYDRARDAVEKTAPNS